MLRRRIKGIRKGTIATGLILASVLSALNLKHDNQDLKVREYELKSKKTRTELDISEKETYRREDLYLFVENLGENPRYYFVDASNRDFDVPYIKLKQNNEITVDLYRKTYQSITNPDHELVYQSNVYYKRDEEKETIIGGDGTIYIGLSGNIPVSSIATNGFMTNFEWPLNYETKQEFTKTELKLIEEYYNKNYEYLYKVKNDQFAIKDLGLLVCDNECFVVDEASKTYLALNPENQEYVYSMECVLDQTLGVLAKNGEVYNMTSRIATVNTELIKRNEAFSYLPLKPFLSKDQINKEYLSKEEIAIIETQLNNKIGKENGTTRCR